MTIAVAALTSLSLLSGSWASPSDPFGGSATFEATAPKGTSVADGDHGVVEERGAVTYSYPITVPPGRNGVAPSLALSYSSQGSLRGLAQGWSLEGTGTVIELDPTAAFATTTRYRVAGGGRLVEVPDIKSSTSMKTYRMEFDASFTRYEWHNDGDAGFWLIKTTDGSTAELRQLVAGRRWLESRRSDEFGNRMDFNWQPAPSSAFMTYELRDISYSANDAAGLAAHARVVFNYGSSTTLETCGTSSVPKGADLEYLGSQGVVTWPRRLRSIKTEVRDTQSSATFRPVAETTLGYDEAALDCSALAAPLRYLTRIDQRGFSAAGPSTYKDLPPVTFTYGARALTYNLTNSVTDAVAPSGVSGNDAGQSTGYEDINGDGLRDMVRVAEVWNSTSQRTMCTMYWRAAIAPEGFETLSFAATEREIVLPTLPWLNEQTKQPTKTASVRERCSLNGQHFYRNVKLGSGVVSCEKPIHGMLGYHFVDYNNDGLVDVLTNAWLPEGTMLTSPVFYSADGPNNTDGGGIWCDSSSSGVPGGCACPFGEDALPDGSCSGVGGGLRGGGGGPGGGDGGATVDPPVWQPPTSQQDCNALTMAPEKVLGVSEPGWCGAASDDQFLLRVFLGTGSNFSGLAMELRTEIPLAPPGEESSLSPSGTPAPYTLQTFVDLDGNGFLDFTSTAGAYDVNAKVCYLPDAGTASKLDAYVGRGGNNFKWKAWPKSSFGAKTASGFNPVHGTGTFTDQMTQTATLQDINGDGRPDLVMQGNLATDGLVYFPNTGSGFGSKVKLGIDEAVERTVVKGTWNGWTPTTATRAAALSLIDVDHDGRPDLVKFDAAGASGTAAPTVRFNQGDSFGPEKVLPAVWNRARRVHEVGADRKWKLKNELADINGDGVQDLVEYGAQGGYTYISPYHWDPIRLLQMVDNGRGAKTLFTYVPSSDRSVWDSDSSPFFDAMAWKMPSHQYVVQSVSVVPGGAQATMTTHYRYAEPKYGGFVGTGADMQPRSFQGFGRVRRWSSAPAGSGSPRGSEVVHRYSYLADGRGYVVDEAVYEWGASAVSWNVSMLAARRLASVTRNEFATGALFDGLVQVIQPIKTETRLCTQAQRQASVAPIGQATAGVDFAAKVYLAEAACRDATDSTVLKQTTETTYSPYLLQNGKTAMLNVATTTERDSLRPDRSIWSSLAYRTDYPSASTNKFVRVQSKSATTWAIPDQGVSKIISKTETGFDSAGFPTESKAWFGPGANDFVKSVSTFDPQTGNLKTSKRAEQVRLNSSLVSTVEYDAHKLFVTLSTNELGHFVTTTTDVGTGAVTRTQGPQSAWVPTNPSCTGTTCAMVARFDEDQFVIDPFGRTVEHKATYNFGKSAADATILLTLSTTQYDDVNNKVIQNEAIEPGSPPARLVTTITQADGTGRTLSSTTCRRLGTLCPDAANDPVTSYQYDGAGLMTQMTMPSPASDSATVTYSFMRDGSGRTTKMLRPDGSAVDIEYAPLYRKASEGGTATSGAATVAHYDLDGLLIQVDEWMKASSSAAGAWETTAYEYDDAGNLVEVIDADGNGTWLEHDLLGRRARIVRGAREWRYEYDHDGNMTAEVSPLPTGATDAAPYRTVTEYDVLGRVWRRTPGTRGMTAAERETLSIGPTVFAYDSGTNGIGQLSGVTQPRPLGTQSPFLTVSYEYNRSGQVKKESRTFNATGVAADSVTQWVQRGYTGLGSMNAAGWDDGRVMATLHDARGLPQQVFHLGGGLPTYTVADYGVRNKAGLPLKRTTPANLGGQERFWTYSPMGRVVNDTVQVPAVTGAPTVLAQRTYTFEASGDLKTLTGSTRRPNGQTKALSLSYTYDSTHRLTSATESVTGYQTGLSYWPSGNINTAKVSGVPQEPGLPNPNRDVTYHYDVVDPQAVHRLENNVTHQDLAYLSYDSAGNMTSRSWPIGQELLMKWDGDDQLRQARTPDGTFERYHYDHTGQRVWARKDSGVDAGTRYWFGESETFVPLASTGQKTRRFFHIGDSGGTLARSETILGGAPRLELHYGDVLQNLMLTTQATTVGTTTTVAVTSWFHYGAFGEVIAQEGQTEHRRQFNGKESDVSTGLRYYGARYYDPLLMRWNSADPLFRFSPDIQLAAPQNHNLYAFTLNNPVHYIDPDGRMTDVAAWNRVDGKYQPMKFTGSVLDVVSFIPVVGDVVDVAVTVYKVAKHVYKGEYAAAGREAAVGAVSLAPGMNRKTAKVAVDVGERVVKKVAGEGAEKAVKKGGGSKKANARFVGQPDGKLVDTNSTPPGSYDQPSGGRTDILQGEDHGSGLSHTHDPVVNVNPKTGKAHVNGRDKKGREVSAEDVKNIEDGTAKPSPPKGR